MPWECGILPAPFVLLCFKLFIITTEKEEWVHLKAFSLDFADGIITMFYTAECFLRIWCLGFIWGPNSYLRNGYNRLDFVIVVDSWVHLGVKSVTGRDLFARIAVLRAFRGLIVLREFSFFSNVLAIIDGIKRSVRPLENVIFLTFLVVSYYSLLALQFLEGSLNKRCIRTSDNQVSFPARFCDKKAGHDGYVCPTSQNQTCLLYGNVNWGATSFDKFPSALLTMFQVISLEGWSLIMYEIKDSESSSADAYFMTLVIIGTYFLINVFVAAISGVFLRVRMEHQILLKRFRRTNPLNLYRVTVMANAMKEAIIKDDSKMKWYERLRNKSYKLRYGIATAMLQGGSFVKLGFQSLSFRMSRRSTLSLSGDEDVIQVQSKKHRIGRNYTRGLSRGLSMGSQAAATLQQKALVAVKSFFFRYSELGCIFLNIVILCLYYEGMSNKLLYSLYALETVFLIIFTAEMVLRFIGYGLVRFVDDQMNLWDILIITISAGAVITRAYPNISAARVLRFFYPSKEVADKHPTTVISCIKSLGSLTSVAFFYLLIIIIFSIIGMELYGGQFYDFSDGYPRANHDTVFQAMLLWLSVTTGESWVNQMWNVMRPGVENNWMAPFIFVFYYAITAYVVLNLIIAVILETTELTDNQKKRIQKLEYIKLIRRRQSHVFSRSGTWLLGAVGDAQAGMKSLRKRMNTMKVRTISLPVGKKSAKHSDELQISSESLTKKVKAKAILKDPDISKALPSVTAFEETGVSNYVQDSCQSTTRDIKEKMGVESSVSPINDKSFKETGGVQRRPSRRASQILQITGFPADITKEGRSRTVLESSVLVLMNDQASIPLVSTSQKSLAEATSSASAAVERSVTKVISVSKQTNKRASFQLSDYEDLESSIKRKQSYLSNKALLIFSEDNYIRKFSCKFVGSVWYMRCTSLWVAVSIFVLMETNAEGHSLALASLIPHLDRAVLIVFAVDFLLKLVAHGLILTPEPYLGNPYHLIDLFNLIVDAFSFLPMNPYAKRTFRVLLALRPLRLVSRFDGMRELFTSLLLTLPAIASVLTFTFSVFGVFAIIGTQMFRGLFASCNDGSVENRAECVGYYINNVAIVSPRVWANPPFHFDNVGNAMLSLFVCSTFDNWLDNWLYVAMDISHNNLQPRRNNSPLYAVYFVLFVFVGGFFVLRMFVGVLIDEFGVHSGSKLLTERQKLWRDMNRIIQKMKPARQIQEPTGLLRHGCYRLVHSKIYSNFMIFVIIANYVFLATHQDGQPVALSLMRKRIQCGFVAFYLLEMIINFLASEFWDYYIDYSIAFEAFLSITGAACLFPQKDSPRQIVGRLVYTTRIFCIIRHVPRAKTLMGTLYVCLPSMVDIMGILMVFLFAFAGIGVQLFAHVKDGVCLGPWINFGSFFHSFVTVFQVTTTDNWSCIMYDTMVEKPFCTYDHILEKDDCGFPIASPIYFVAVVTISAHIFMNLFVAIILDTITFGLLNENAMITPDHLYKFQLLWGNKEFDPRCTGYIGLHKLRTFVNRLGHPLGCRHKDPFAWYARIEYEVLHFHIPNKGVPFKHLLETLTLYKVGPTVSIFKVAFNHFKVKSIYLIIRLIFYLVY
ncbi:hypothetical protein O6H91_14G042100 [Diphasiastrum complanatum]|uniref:Uncharacterized protein n=1 Tax=Diphasiastrum complanatum TaxID=34168 RepID=A0ACC2BNL7_DIPCM|nr:hypothetical protein O6H91_14G042100 [Diphasiastrum complanatum]